MIFYTYSVHSFRREYSFLLLKFLFFSMRKETFSLAFCPGIPFRKKFLRPIDFIGMPFLVSKTAA